MGSTIDHDQNVDVTGKVNQIADLTRTPLKELADEGLLTADQLQQAIESGDLFQEVVKPLLLDAVTRVYSAGKMIDSALLEGVKMIPLVPIADFDPAKKFVKGTQDGVKIGWVGDNLKGILKRHKKISVSKANLRCHKLKEPSVDGPIVKALGGRELISTNFAHMWEMMKKQGNGEEGDLLVNGYANIFYIPDPEDEAVIWAVRCSWNAVLGGWYVVAFSITSPYGWFADYRVFSR